jgi:glycosyltransferase involved in cell wall biosynthesis
MSSEYPKQCRLHVLYIVYWGVLEPLGQALVVPTLLRFAADGLHVTLVSYEKPAHLADLERVEKSAQQLRAAGIDWIPRRYHRRPTVPATAWDVGQGCATGIIAALRSRPDLVHGRTYLGGVIGGLVSRLLRRPFIFHNDGFWPDEQVDGGNWAAESWQYRATKQIELGLYNRADAVITLSETARGIVRALRPTRREESTLVVPSCVDLQRFRPMSQPSDQNKNGRLVYVGSLGGRYLVSEMAQFLKAARHEMPSASLTVYSHSSPALIRSGLQNNGIEDDWWSLDFVPHDEIPRAISSQQAGLFFLARGVSSRVCSPTKIGEYWASGLPVVTTPDVGDVDAVVRRDRVGVIVEADTDAACRKAARELRLLLEDPELPQRCRRAAECYYSLDQAVEVQLRLYDQVTQ